MEEDDIVVQLNKLLEISKLIDYHEEDPEYAELLSKPIPVGYFVIEIRYRGYEHAWYDEQGTFTGAYVIIAQPTDQPHTYRDIYDRIYHQDIWVLDSWEHIPKWDWALRCQIFSPYVNFIAVYV